MNHSLEVFDFKEEDELPESAADKLLSKFKNPNVDDSTVLKCEFLGMFVHLLRIEIFLCVVFFLYFFPFEFVLV
ncbi:hypothetical protein SLEP1_g30071 [Rubroshorea leprosula]|uniref:Uncharacterized protein n=1 Tax=Rubroshorea leprosula TaxID=152421 RepID=A0AAV5K9Q8_9ROSI|nr:hypothetical protein SLEP1_g30071 [Rubroshorea leprosula]